jgi:ATP-binding cassette, subfamily G (WHITE), member 2, SNQ2
MSFLIQLFDKVLVIHDGRCVFFGARQRAKQYFQGLGFYCAPRQTTADFLTAVTDPHARMIAERFEDKVPRSADEFETCFQNGADGTLNLSVIAAFEEEIKNRQGSPNSIHRRSVYTLPFYKQVSVCTSRQFQVLLGDKLTFFAKFGLAIFQSLIFGSLFYNQPATSSGVFTRGGVILCLISHCC